MTAPRHPQLMAPADDPEEFIAASIYWYPRLFATRTEVLDHTFLCNGNGYEWGGDGMIHSVFAHIPVDREDCIARELREADEEEVKEIRRYGKLLRLDDSFAPWYRQQAAEMQAVRNDYLHRARTYGPARVTEQVPGEGNGCLYQARTLAADYVQRWTLLGRTPQNVAPQWAAVLDEVRELFAPVFTEQETLW